MPLSRCRTIVTPMEDAAATMGSRPMDDDQHTPLGNDPSTGGPLPPPTPASSRRRWVDVAIARDRSSRMGGGVVAGVARSYGLDRRLARTVFAVLTLPIPALVLVYVAAWIVLPADAAQAASLRQLLADRRRRPLLIVLAVALAISGIVGNIGDLVGGRGLGWALGLIIIGVMLWVMPERSTPPQQPWAPPRAWSTGSAAVESTVGGAPSGRAWQPARPADAAGPQDRAPTWADDVSVPARLVRPRRPIGALAIAGTIVAVGFVRVGDSFGWWHISVLGTLLAAIGFLTLATIASAVVNGRYGRLVLVVPLALLGVALSIARPTFEGGVGKRTEVPVDGLAPIHRQLAIGELELDLRPALASGIPADVRAEVGVGRLHVILPAGVPMRVHARLGAGHVTIDGRQVMSGVSLDQVVEVRADSTTPTPAREVALDLKVGTGEISIERTASVSGR